MVAHVHLNCMADLCKLRVRQKGRLGAYTSLASRDWRRPGRRNLKLSHVISRLRKYLSASTRSVQSSRDFASRCLSILHFASNIHLTIAARLAGLFRIARVAEICKDAGRTVDMRIDAVAHHRRLGRGELL